MTVNIFDSGTIVHVDPHTDLDRALVNEAMTSFASMIP
jgi:hypothetical protein